MSTLSDALGFTQNPEGSTEPSVAINANADQAAQLFGGYYVRDLIADADYELLEADYLTAVLIVTDDGTVLTGPVSLIYPDAFPTQLVVNNTAQDLTAKKEGQTGVVVPAGESVRVSCGAVDVLEQTKAPAFLGGDLSDALNEAMGANIASAATTDVGAATGNTVTVTGNATITALGTAPAGAGRIVIFSGTPTLTHHATSLILPTGANIIVAAGDVATFRSEGSGNWRCTGYTRASGAPLVPAPALSIVTEASAFTADPGTHDGLGRYVRAGGNVTFDNAEPYTAGMVFNLRATAAIELIEDGITLTPPTGGTLELDADMSVTVVMTSSTAGDVIGQTVPA